jgi:ATP-dependent Lon protease
MTLFDSKFSDKLSFSGGISEDTEFIPLVQTEEEENLQNEEVPEWLPLLPLRNMVLFPGVVMPITVGRDKSIRLIREVQDQGKIIGVVAQKDAEVEDPRAEDLYKVGTIARILKTLRMPDGSTTVIIQGKRRFHVGKIDETGPYLKTTYTLLTEKKPAPDDREFDTMVQEIKELAMQLVQQNPNVPAEAGFALQNIDSPAFLVNFVSSNLNDGLEVKQRLLEMVDLKERTTDLLRALHHEAQLMEIKNQIHTKVRVDIDKQQRDYFLHQQMRTIQEELGGGEAEEVRRLKAKGEKMAWPEHAAQAFRKELAKLERMNSMVAEYSVQLNYLDFMTDLPWHFTTKDRFDLARAAKILDRDHYGLEKVKERILEHLAVLKLRGDMKAPILCLVGPPGVGKTSLGKSIAEALGRKYVRMSLGGLKDESEIRGHRRTYIGAMAGRLLQNLKKADYGNPVFILDEIDKLSRDIHGDPSSALLEVLDPEQNHAFHDNYLDVDYDLSKVLFIATANDLQSIQPALLDRMEVIRIPGYATEEKIEIARKHILPKLLVQHGLEKNLLRLQAKQLSFIIDHYTRESGVRHLERRMAALVRKIAIQTASGQPIETEWSKETISEVLGIPIPRETYENNDLAGVVTGLAWTAVGGDILFIESSLTVGKGKLTLTGNLGGVMKESALIALEYLRSHAHLYHIPVGAFDRYNVHIHIPEGAVPKDGPSAGITLFTALVSLFTQRKIKARLAMTGELTLRGQVLPVGGIKEKVLAARRAQIKEVILPYENRRDVQEIPEAYVKGLEFHFVKTLDEVVSIALLDAKVKGALKIK